MLPRDPVFPSHGPTTFALFVLIVCSLRSLLLTHTVASHLMLANYNIQTIQKLLGHGDVRTTMIYLQTVPSVTLTEARSPMDLVG
jgi:site-specific recombinase XerD